MRRFILHFSFLIIGSLSLQACHPNSPFISQNKDSQQEPNQFEQLAKFGSGFALQLDAKPKSTCKKYIRLHKNGDWRASWVLALTAIQPENIQCVKTNDAILVLTTLELQNKINSDLIWLNQSYLALLFKLQENKKTISQLNQTINDTTQHSTSLEEEKEELSEKIEALKNIETNIIK